MQNNNEQKTTESATMSGKYLDPKADLTFKLVFGEHPDLVMSLLNALLPLDEDSQITSVEYWPSELVPENPGKKDSVVDEMCGPAGPSVYRGDATLLEQVLPAACTS